MVVVYIVAGLMSVGMVPTVPSVTRTDLRITLPAGVDPDPAGQTFPTPVGVIPTNPRDLATSVDPPASAATLERWQAAGFTIGFSTTWDVSATTSAAAGRQAIARSLVATSVGIDLEKTIGVEGASAFAQFLWKRGPNGSTYTRDLHGFSNLDADPFSGLGELWVESRLGDHLRLKAGRVDANTEFAGVPVASDFLNSAMGVSPAITHLPTYPDPAVSLNLFADVHPRLTLGAGIYGEASRGLRWQRPFSIGEVKTTWTLGATRDGTVRVGGWRKQGSTLPVERGAYVVVEQTLWTRPDEGASVASFVQWGHTRESCGVDRHLGGGLVWKGWWASRPEDAVGFGMTGVRGGSRSEYPGKRELVFASYARIVVAPVLALTPDLQVIRSGTSSNRVVGTLRITAGF